MPHQDHELNADDVDRLAMACMIDDQRSPDAVKVEGIVRTYLFSKAALNHHKAEIVTLVNYLNPNFFEGGGGGWSFSEICRDANGRQWTGLHVKCEALCCLAIGVDYGAWIMTRDEWPAFPGGVPYITFGEGVEGSMTLPS